MMLSHLVEHARVPIYHAMAPEQPSPCVMRGNFMTALPLLQPGPCIVHAPHLQPLEPADHAGINIMTFAHLVHTQANTIKFAHQSLGNPKISTWLKATHKGFLKGCPNIFESLILQYLNPSPTTTKGHMKCPHHGIMSTRPKAPKLKPIPIIPNAPRQPAAQINPLVLPLFHEVQAYPGPGYGTTTGPNLIGDDDNESIANDFCVEAFADKYNGIVNHDLTVSFPFMPYKESIWFFILYHYESNSILTMPIAGLDDVTTFNAYKQQFELLTSKGFKPKLNVVDNQATKYIKIFRTKQDGKLQLVEPHNHRSTRPNAQFKCSRMHLLPHLQQPSMISLSSCGIN
jgi:hypothetical protein